MPRFVVKAGQAVDTGAKIFAAGETLELAEEQAAAMPWAVEPAPAPAGKPKADSASSK